MFTICPVGQHLDGAFHRLPQIEVERFKADLACLHLGKIQDVVDDTEQDLGAGLNGLHKIALFRVELRVVQQHRHADDPIERRSDFMADIGEELRLEPSDLDRFVPGLRQLLFDPFALGDVHHGANHADGAARGIASHVRTIQNVGIPSIRTPVAVFIRPEVVTLFDDRTLTVQDAFPVFGMYVLVPPVPVIFHRLGRVTEDTLDAFVPPYAVGVEIPVPDGVVGGPGDQLEAFFAFSKRSLRISPLGDLAFVDDDGADHGILDEIGGRTFHPVVIACLRAQAIVMSGGLPRLGQQVLKGAPMVS
jgi:hypothetical protein